MDEKSPQSIEFLKSHTVGSLATVNEDGSPWISAVYYVADESGNIYFLTRNQTAKLQNLRREPRVAFEVTDADQQSSVQISGEAYELVDQNKMNLTYEQIQRTMLSVRHPLPIEKLRDQGDYLIIKIQPTRTHFVDYTKLF